MSSESGLNAKLEETANNLNRAALAEKKPSGFWAGVRKWSWKFFGALFMRDKGTNGTEKQAISAHKFVGLILLAVCLGIWIFGGTYLTPEEKMRLLEAGQQLPPRWGDPPDFLVYSWWGLLGLVDLGKGTLDLMRKR